MGTARLILSVGFLGSGINQEACFLGTWVPLQGELAENLSIPDLHAYQAELSFGHPDVKYSGQQSSFAEFLHILLMNTFTLLLLFFADVRTQLLRPSNVTKRPDALYVS